MSGLIAQSISVIPARKAYSMKKFIAVALASTFLASCQTNDPYTGQQRVSRTLIGTGLGAAGGALVGQLVGKDRKATLIGAGIGALAGGAIGNYQDRQAAALEQRLRNTGVSITRQGNNIILNMPSNITFGSDQANIRSDFYPVLDSVALVLKEYNQTLVDVYGHTDSDGSDQYNKNLSEQRASNVARYLINRGTDQRRYYVVGYGESQPIASNATAQGKEQNRRVEIQIAPIT